MNFRRFLVLPFLLIFISSACSNSIIQPTSYSDENPQDTQQSINQETQDFSPTEPTSKSINERNEDHLSQNETEENDADILTSDWCERPYAKDSIWNTPIDWTSTKFHSRSDAMISAFFQTRKWISSNTDSYAPNIYFVTDETPLVAVKLRKNRFRDAINDSFIVYGDPASIVWMPIPDDAVPAPGTDGQLAIINLTSREEWGLIKAEITSDGQWLATGAYRYHIDNSGVPPEGFGQRGSGIGQLAGVVRPCEVERGFIGHAVTLAYDSPCEPAVCLLNNWPPVIPPFTKTDGRGKLLDDIPEGARIVIRPDITWEQINQACHEVKGCVTWAISMQIYGGFIADNSDHPKTYAEGTGTANWDPDVWNRNMLRDIPTEWFAIIDF